MRPRSIVADSTNWLSRFGRALRSPEGIREILLVLLAFTSGYVDAVSYFGLGRVFTSVMTGNTVVLGIALSQGNWVDVARTLTALASYLLGVAIGTLVLEHRTHTGIWPSPVTAACAVELGMLLAFAVGGVLAGRPSNGGVIYLLVALAGTAMGIQSAAVRVLNVSGVTTTYFTGTWTAFVEGIVRHLRAVAGLPNSANPNRMPPSRLTLARQGAVLLSYALAAIVGSIGILHWQLRAAAFPLVPFALVLALAWLRFTPDIATTAETPL